MRKELGGRQVTWKLGRRARVPFVLVRDATERRAFVNVTDRRRRRPVVVLREGAHRAAHHHDVEVKDEANSLYVHAPALSSGRCALTSRNSAAAPSSTPANDSELPRSLHADSSNSLLERVHQELTAASISDQLQPLGSR